MASSNNRALYILLGVIAALFLLCTSAIGGLFYLAHTGGLERAILRIMGVDAEMLETVQLRMEYNQLLESGNEAGAEAMLLDLLDLSPETDRGKLHFALDELVDLYIDQQRWNEALDLLDKIDTIPTPPEAREFSYRLLWFHDGYTDGQRVSIALFRGDFARAAELVTDTTSDEPDLQIPWLLEYSAAVPLAAIELAERQGDTRFAELALVARAAAYYDWEDDLDEEMLEVMGMMGFDDPFSSQGDPMFTGRASDAEGCHRIGPSFPGVRASLMRVADMPNEETEAEWDKFRNMPTECYHYDYNHLTPLLLTLDHALAIGDHESADGLLRYLLFTATEAQREKASDRRQGFFYSLSLIRQEAWLAAHPLERIEARLRETHSADSELVTMIGELREQIEELGTR